MKTSENKEEINTSFNIISYRNINKLIELRNVIDKEQDVIEEVNEYASGAGKLAYIAEDGDILIGYVEVI